MNTSETSAYERLARQALDEGSHYARTVAEMIGGGNLIAEADIHAVDGTKLAAKGSLVDEKFRTALLQQKVAKPNLLCLSIRGEYMPEYLARRTARLIDENTSLRQLAERSGDELALRHGLARVPVTPQMCFMLTVAREQRPQLFRHLLTVALIVHYLALRRGLSEHKTAALLVAALCHDFGELHIDPLLFDPAHRISNDERRHLYVHPITGCLILRDMVDVDPAIAVAVLQHQERLDGSGYPYGLRGSQIGSFGRLVGTADVCASILDRFGSNERLSTLTRLNRQKFDPDLLALLHEGLGRSLDQGTQQAVIALPRLQTAAQLLGHWSAFRAALAAATAGEPPAYLDFLFERMNNLRSILLQFGFDPDAPQQLLGLAAEDPEVAAELAAALDEVHWQFSDLEREIERRRQTLTPMLSSAESGLFERWSRELKDYLAPPDNPPSVPANSGVA